MPPRISVISSAYNAASHYAFGTSVRSILNQSFSDFEFIICDDGSSDSTYSHLLALAKMDNRIRLIRNEKNLGIAPSLNKCIALSQASLIARHDLDDVSDNSRLEKEFIHLTKKPQVAFLGTSVYYFDKRGVYAREIKKPNVEKRDFLFTSPMVHGSVMLRREALFRVGLYDESRSTVRNEDYDLFMRMAEHFKGENLREPLYYFCEDTETLRRRKYIYRINEARVRYRGFLRLGLMPRAFPYVIKPLAVGLIPKRVLSALRKRRRENM